MHRLLVLQNRLEHACYKRFGYPVVTCGRPDAPKRALLAYLSPGVKWRENDPRFGWHQNCRQSRELAHLLVQRGYWVDVVQHNDPRFVPSGRYDLVVAHPGAVSKRVQALPKTGFRLCIRTGRHAAFVDRAMAERHERLRQSRGWAPEWKGLEETDEVYRGYDAIACFDGNGTTSATFSGVGIPVYSFRNHANPDIEYIEKDVGEGRSGFLYMSGQLHLLKGLDWLIESFAETPERQLYICGKIPEELSRLYASELARPNIHAMGYVKLDSNIFHRLCQRAAWYVSPSASDGCQGTAIDAMAAGLVPILSEACGVDARDAGVQLYPCTPETLRFALDMAASTLLEEIIDRSRRARIRVESHYMPCHFLNDWNDILDCVGA